MRKVLLMPALATALTLLPAGALSAAAAGTAMVNKPAQGVVISHNNVVSTNWGGYAVQDASRFTDVKGSWIQPAVTCPASGQEYSSFWVGIDGYSSNSVEQLGTDSDCSNGSPQYYGWYEMYPANSVNISRTTYPVKPGDTLTAEVSVSGTSFTLSLTSSRGWVFSITKTGARVKQSSAEWITESPEICGATCQLAKLSDFGKVTWTGAEAAVAGGSDLPISSFTANNGPHNITCKTSAGVVRDRSSALTSNAEGFATTWKHD